MSVGAFAETMFRARPHKIRVQLLVEATELPVSPLLSTYTHRLIGKLHHTDADADAVFNLTNIFAVDDEATKVVEATIPTTATSDTTDIPVGRTTRIYLQWQTTDGAGQPWIVADGSLTVRSSLPQTP